MKKWMITLLGSTLLATGSAQAEEPRSDQVPRRSPLLAVCLSAAVPGGGQLYTQQYLRAAAFAGGLGYLGYSYRREDLAAVGNPDPDDYNYHDARRRKYKWWFIGIWTLSLADAYVDAHLFKFDQHSEPSLSLKFGPDGLSLVKIF